MLPAEPVDMLSQILPYPVVPWKMLAADVVKMASLATVQKNILKVTMDGSLVKVDGVTIIITERETSNGGIHVIDAVSSRFPSAMTQ
jgi:uncharacterized surface protein with fasciclin (FAS1) repeats